MTLSKTDRVYPKGNYKLWIMISIKVSIYLWFVFYRHINCIHLSTCHKSFCMN